MSIIPTNAERADRAEACADVHAQLASDVTHFEDLFQNDGEDARACLKDLISDVFHLAKAHGWDPKMLMFQAYENYEADRFEEAHG